MDKDIAEIVQLLETEKHKLRLFSSPYLSENLMAGIFRSIFSGKGVVPTNSRPYLSGDDLSKIDIATTLRNGGVFYRGKEFLLPQSTAIGTVFLKQFEVEKENNMLIILDGGWTMNFRKERFNKYKTKLYHLFLLFDVFSHWGLKSGFGMRYYFFDDTYQSFPSLGYSKNPSLKKLFIDKYIAFLETRNNPSTENISLLISFIMRNVKYRSVIFLISDFYPRQNFGRLLSEMARKHFVIPIILYDENESFDRRMFDFKVGSNALYSATLCLRKHRNTENYYQLIAREIKDVGINPLIFNVEKSINGEEIIQRVERYLIELLKR